MAIKLSRKPKGSLMSSSRVIGGDLPLKIQKKLIERVKAQRGAV